MLHVGPKYVCLTPHVAASTCAQSEADWRMVLAATTSNEIYVNLLFYIQYQTRCLTSLSVIAGKRLELLVDVALAVLITCILPPVVIPVHVPELRCALRNNSLPSSIGFRL